MGSLCDVAKEEEVSNFREQVKMNSVQTILICYSPMRVLEAEGAVNSDQTEWERFQYLLVRRL